MKALDTPVLLALLEGDPRVRQALKRTRGEELAATEVNLLELTLIASQGGGRSRAARLAALSRLRRRITVLPIDSKAGEGALRWAAGAAGSLSPSTLAMCTTLEANGCEELLTEDPRQIPGRWGFRVSSLNVKQSKKPK